MLIHGSIHASTSNQHIVAIFDNIDNVSDTLSIVKQRIIGIGVIVVGCLVKCCTAQIEPFATADVEILTSITKSIISVAIRNIYTIPCFSCVFGNPCFNCTRTTIVQTDKNLVGSDFLVDEDVMDVLAVGHVKHNCPSIAMVSGFSYDTVENGLVCSEIQIAIAIFCKNTTDTSIGVRQINNFCSCLVSIHRCILVQLFAVIGCNKEIILTIRQQNTIRAACNVIADICPRNTVIRG